MADDDPSDEDLPDNVLFELYRQYIGEPDDQIDVYLGFGLFFGGIALAAFGLVFFLTGAAFEHGSDTFWLFREIAFSMGMLSVPTLLLGVLVLLPVDARAVYTGLLGTVITVVAVGGFAYLYPWEFNVEGAEYTIHVVLAYAIGMALVLVSTGAALVAHQIERAKPSPADIEPMEEPEPTESYTDEEIRQDIEEAMSDVDITWGGVERHEGQSLTLDMGDADYDLSGMDVDAERITSSSSTDTQVQGLKALKGGEKKTATSTSTVDDQTTKLNELRQRRKEEQQSKAVTESSEGLFAKIKAFLGGRSR
ncbi:DUF7139 domain-containing protein [Halapricum hydrolyticum]|uniref:Permease n=1 Tax=Halapricum hydrolyticum TaxID=2979991 RepID=A0AAE3IF60_9EURY|nr:hypothetical protein [Halapricum hydrolyticum]MCU4718477.1 permease [Halapricum hydrolyticum]MCU4727504.1 permease [Halapricum hydrolyticum]